MRDRRVQPNAIRGHDGCRDASTERVIDIARADERGKRYAGERMHAPNENIRLDDYFRQIEFLVELMRRFATESADTGAPVAVR